MPEDLPVALFAQESLQGCWLPLVITPLVKGPLYQMRVTVHRTRDQTRTLLHNEERRFVAGNGQQEGHTGQAVLLEMPVGASDLTISMMLLDLMPGLDDDERLLARMNAVRIIWTPPDCKAEEQADAERDGAILIRAGGGGENGTRNSGEAGPASHPEEVATSLQLGGRRCVAGRASTFNIGAAGLVHGIHYRFTVRVIVKLGGAQAHFEAVDFLGQGESQEFLTALPPLPENEYRLFVSIEDRHPASPDEALLASSERLLACPFFSEGQQDGKDEPRGANSGQTRDSALRDTLLLWRSHHLQASHAPAVSNSQSKSPQAQVTRKLPASTLAPNGTGVEFSVEQGHDAAPEGSSCDDRGVDDVRDAGCLVALKWAPTAHRAGCDSEVCRPTLSVVLWLKDVSAADWQHISSWHRAHSSVEIFVYTEEAFSSAHHAFLNSMLLQTFTTSSSPSSSSSTNSTHAPGTVFFLTDLSYLRFVGRRLGGPGTRFRRVGLHAWKLRSLKPEVEDEEMLDYR